MRSSGTLIRDPGGQLVLGVLGMAMERSEEVLEGDGLGGGRCRRRRGLGVHLGLGRHVSGAALPSQEEKWVGKICGVAYCVLGYRILRGPPRLLKRLS